MNQGIITQIIGPVVDAVFSKKLPGIYNALYILLSNGKKLTLEVEQHVGNGEVRSIALASTDGITRGTVVYDTGAPISVPVGPETLGRIVNVLGEVLEEGRSE